MEKAAFSYSNTAASLCLAAALPGFLIGLGMFALGIYGATFIGEMYRENQLTLLGLPVLLYMGVYMFVGLYHLLAYRHIYRMTYEVGDLGITAQTPTETQSIPWSDFESADHLTQFSILRLRTHRLARPVVLYLTPKLTPFGNHPAERNGLALRLVAAGMGSKLRKIWGP